MKNNTIKILLAALYFSTMSTGLLSMDDPSFVAETKAIVFRANTISRREDIYQRLDHIDNSLEQKHRRLVAIAVCSGPHMAKNMAKATEVSNDIKAVKLSKNHFNGILAGNNTIKDAADGTKAFIVSRFDTKRSTTQSLLKIFSFPSLSDRNR